MQMETKLVWVLVVVLVSCCYCVEGGRGSGGVGGIYGQEQRHQFRKGKSVEAAWKTTTTAAPVAYTAKGVDNHHNIPRQNYDNWGSNGGSPVEGGDAGGSGSSLVPSAP